MRQLARGTNLRNLRGFHAMAIEVGIFQAAIRQLPDLIDTLIAEHHDALLDRIVLRINEAAGEAAA